MFAFLFGGRKEDQRSYKGCRRCNVLYATKSISIPSDFRKILSVIRANMEDKTIIESDYWPDHLIINDCETPFDMVTGKGKPLEEVYTYYFECPKCGQLYQLFCSTVQGCKGKWRPLIESDFR